MSPSQNPDHCNVLLQCEVPYSQMLGINIWIQWRCRGGIVLPTMGSPMPCKDGGRNLSHPFNYELIYSEVDFLKYKVVHNYLNVQQ